MIVNLVSTAILNLFKDSITLVGLLTVMFYQNWKLSLISIVMIPLASFAARSLGKRVGKATTEHMQLAEVLVLAVVGLLVILLVVRPVLTRLFESMPTAFAGGPGGMIGDGEGVALAQLTGLSLIHI